MNVNTYLRYNNIALVDPQVGFHASCIAQFNEKGYLSAKQLEHLRSWNHSPEAIVRLTAGLEERSTIVEPEVTEPRVNKSKWSATELEALFKLITEHNSVVEVEVLASALNRTAGAVKHALYKYSDCAIKRNKVIYCARNMDEIPF